jgi:hypothetical protein
LALGAPGSGPIDLDAAEQLIRTSSGGGPVLDAMMKILRRDLAERTPAAGTVMPEVEEAVTTLRRAMPSAARSRLDPEDRTQQVALSQVVDEGNPTREG